MENIIFQIVTEKVSITTNNLFLGVCLIGIGGIVVYSLGQTLIRFKHKKSIEK